MIIVMIIIIMITMKITTMPCFAHQEQNRAEIWIKVEESEIITTKTPKDLKVNSHNKEETMLMHESDMFDEELKEKFSLFPFVHNARKLLEGTVIQKMYPAQVLTKLNNIEESKVAEEEENFISYRK